jgi:hypothetical protein
MIERSEREDAELHAGAGDGGGGGADRAVPSGRDERVDPRLSGDLAAMTVEIARLDGEDPGLDAVRGE